jgi:alpha-mannosidase
MFRTCKVFQRFLVPAMMALPPVSAFAGSQIVWQIGKFDKSTLEYAEWASANEEGGAGCGGVKRAEVPEIGQGSSQTAYDLVYVIGKSQTAEWACFQAGSSNGLEGYRPHPYAIQFDLPSKPSGLYTLKVALLVKSPRVSRLEVSINGHRALYFQHPVLDYDRGDDAGSYMPNYSSDTIDAELPTQFLNHGTNELVLTAIDDLPNRDDVTDSGIYYDALALEQDAQSEHSPGALTVDVQPTIFYVHKDGSLDELVDVFVRSGSSLSDGDVALSLGGARYTARFPSGWEFGEQMAEFAVPEFPAGIKGEVTVHVASTSQSIPVTLVPARKWHFFIVPNVHLDIGYTDYQGKVAEIQSRILDEAIDLTQEHPKYRFSADAFWSVQQFMAWRSDAQKQRLIQAMNEKKIFVPTQEANLLTGFASLEVLFRSLYPGFEFHQKFGGDANYANITDVPSYSWSYASVMAAAGLKYFFAASNNDRAPILLQGRLHEDSPFWWEGPDGGRVLMWYSRHYHQVWSLFRLPPSIEGGHDSMPLFTQIYSRPSYKADSILVYGTQAENSDLFPQQATFVDKWNNTYVYPQMSYSGFVEALTQIAGQFGDSIPVVRGDGGPYWEDGIPSTARSAAVERENEQRALGAEKFTTLSSVVNPRLHPDADEFKRLWDNMVLYDEHTWTYYAAETDPHRLETEQQLATKENFANEAKRDVDDVMRRSLASLADRISAPHGTLLVFNPLSWQRSSLVEVDLDKGKELVDLTTGQTVPYEILTSGRDYLHVRFLARDMPSVGYKAYAIRPAIKTPSSPPISIAPVIESRYYRVVLDPESGSVKSIFDKELNKELVSSSSPYRFNQYLYVAGGDKEPNRSIKPTLAAPLPDYTIHGAHQGRIVSVTDQPYGVVAHLESQGVNTPKIESEIILFNDQKKIEFINRVHKTEVFTKEGVYFAFPFAMEHPQFRYDIQNGFVDPSRDQLPGAGKEWFSVQHWVAADEGPVSVALAPVDASLICLGDIFRATWPAQFGQRPGTIFSYVMNNYWDTNYAAGQGGDFTFRYVLTSGQQLSPASLSRFGREEMTPLEVDQITEEDKSIDSPRPLSRTSGSFVQVSQPSVVLVTWKMAEDGDGTIMRFLETGGESNTVLVQVPNLDVKSAWTADALERKESALETSAHGFQFSVKPFQIVSVRLQGAGNVREFRATPSIKGN